ncbi:MAG: OmpH family outer membrane protein [Alphaproteobacteria bacterium]|nr:OmpH family outer membrane protein [Alphaproteobacteria bacterium]
MRSKHSHYQDLCKDMRYLLAFSYIFVVLFSVAAQDEQKNVQIIAIVDLKKVASESKAGRGIDQQVAEKNKESKKELTDLETKIESMESNKLSGSDPRKVEELQLILYDMVKERRFQISEAYRAAIATLETIIKDAIKEITIEMGIDIVLASDAVVFSAENCKDITNEVIKKVDLKCDHIDLNVVGKNK